MRHSQAIVQVVDVPLLIPAQKAATTEICPQCGGPAEVDLFWSTSPGCPGLKVLKKQTCCGGRRGRHSRFRAQPLKRCPVKVEIVESQPICSAVPLPPELEIPFDPSQLDAAIALLARLDEAECAQLLRAARLTRQLRERKATLKSKLTVGADHGATDRL
ncbi:MAG: hypothetical protein KF760_04855 [Candidatus Eremiobacteraeota bacterium]|nr:hypothetical protein [Candidatus Eremiobacteraeota bacterium]